MATSLTGSFYVKDYFSFFLKEGNKLASVLIGTLFALNLQNTL